MTRREATTAALASLPALATAMAAWLAADSARRADDRTYQGAAEGLGELAEEIRVLNKRLARLEAKDD